MSGDEAICLLGYFDRMLDCTYPPKDISDAIGFNKTTYSSVSVAIESRNDTSFVFAFYLHIPYEHHDEEYMSIDNPIIKKYLEESKKEKKMLVENDIEKHAQILEEKGQVAFILNNILYVIHDAIVEDGYMVNLHDPFDLDEGQPYDGGLCTGSARDAVEFLGLGGD